LPIASPLATRRREATPNASPEPDWPLERAANDLAQQGGLLSLLLLDDWRPPRSFQGGLGGVQHRVVVTLLSGEGSELLDDRTAAPDWRQVGGYAPPAPAHELPQLLSAHLPFHDFQHQVRLFTGQPLRFGHRLTPLPGLEPQAG